jgi:hypothetical protein
VPGRPRLNRPWFGVLVLVGGSPFDYAGLGSTDRMRHGMQEARGSSPLSSTADQRIDFELLTGDHDLPRGAV